MTDQQIRVRTEGFRAIKQSDIIIDGITVVAGENGCGKSTLSKLLYYLFKTTSGYNDLVADSLRYKLRNVDRFLDIVQHETFQIEKDRTKRDELRKELFEAKRNSENSLEDQMSKLISIIQKSCDFYSNGLKNLKESDRNLLSFNRLKNIIHDIVNDKDYNSEDTIQVLFEKVIYAVEGLYKEAFGKMQSRPISLFNEALRDVFNDDKLPDLFEVIEFSQQIISTNKTSLAIPYSIQTAIYVDTPMMIGEEFTENQHWDDLNELLKKRGKSFDKKVSKTISKEIISGEVSSEDTALSTFDFTFKRSDGAIFNLLDCATGVKSFAILQLLLKNGSITDKTLLIIDEPESHLHPQWIIEYARMIVIMNKELGVKFFIASHNPDMVSAIRYISEKENNCKGLNFYLAENANNEFVFNYKHLRTEIDPIFASFNIALERINQYGS